MKGAAAAPGLYGKLASQGDFVTRRLPPDFVREWDLWLQEGMRALRRRHGDGWLALYLHAPVWRFALARGICGVLLPSVDRVGRHFPLTLAIVQDDARQASPFALAAGGAAWFDALSGLALRAMCGELSLADLDAALLALGTPHGDLAPRATSHLAQRHATSLFWTDGAPSMVPAMFLCDGLPATHELGVMFGAGL